MENIKQIFLFFGFRSYRNIPGIYTNEVCTYRGHSHCCTLQQYYSHYITQFTNLGHNNNNLDWGRVPLFSPWKHCSQCGLLYDSPFSKRSYFGRQVPLVSTNHGRPLAARGGTMGAKWWPNGPRVLLHAENLRHGTDNFTSILAEDF